MNLTKTQIMSLENTQMVIDNHNIEYVDHYIYHHHTVKIGEENQTAENCDDMGGFWPFQFYQKSSHTAVLEKKCTISVY